MLKLKECTIGCSGTYPKGGVSSFDKRFLLDESLVLRMKFGAENRFFTKRKTIVFIGKHDTEKK